MNSLYLADTAAHFSVTVHTKKPSISTVVVGNLKFSVGVTLIMRLNSWFGDLRRP